MRIGLDCTPLLGRRSGIGTYTLHLLEALVDRYPHDEFAATAFMPPVGRAAGVVTIHDLAYLRFPETVSAATLAYRELVPKGLARVGAVVVPSRAVADQVLDAYAVDPASVVVTHEGVDPVWGATAPKTPDALRQWGIAEDFLVVVGTLEPRKNLPRLLAAYAAALRDDPDLPQLVIVGGQGWGDALDLTGVPDGQVVTPGHLPWADLRGVVASARALLFPSLDEGFGLPPLEALACGTRRHPGPPRGPRGPGPLRPAAGRRGHRGRHRRRHGCSGRHGDHAPGLGGPLHLACVRRGDAHGIRPGSAADPLIR